jgi:hypothetical protein
MPELNKPDGNLESIREEYEGMNEESKSVQQSVVTDDAAKNNAISDAKNDQPLG